jgi:hypothetical protein
MQCSCSNTQLEEYAGGHTQTFNAGGMRISITGPGAVTINGKRYGSGSSSSGTSIPSRPSSSSSSRPSSSSSGPNADDVTDIGRTKLIYYGNVSSAMRSAMERNVASCRRHMEAKNLGWVMDCNILVKFSAAGWGGTYVGASDELYVTPTLNESSLLYTIVHEFGHRFQCRVSRGIWSEVTGKYRWCLQNDSTAFPRDYSRKNDQEFWADNFASWVLGRRMNP